MRCEKHDEETAVSCGRCSSPVCPKCMVHSDVGVRCKNCAGDRVGKPAGGKGSRVVLLGVAALVGILVLGSLGKGALGSSSKSSLPERARVDSTTTADRMVDPWLSDDVDVKAPDGFRFVAIEITIQNETTSEGSEYADPEDYTITDDSNFVYGALYEDGAQPPLPYLSVKPGQKTRGWVTFQIPTAARVVSLDDYEDTLPLPK